MIIFFDENPHAQASDAVNELTRKKPVVGKFISAECNLSIKKSLAIQLLEVKILNFKKDVNGKKLGRTLLWTIPRTVFSSARAPLISTWNRLRRDQLEALLP